MKADQQTGRRIKQLRVERGLSQRDIGEPGMSYAYVSRIEAGKRTPSLTALINIADKLDTTALYLATGSDGPCPFCGRRS
jgi:transcriptional regulator with XRE-family HTH domain